MLPLMLGLLLSSVGAQSLTPAHGPLGLSADPSKTCLKRSVFVYTSASSTYIFTDLGTTSPPTQTSLCSNETTVTATIYSATTTTFTIPGLRETVTAALPALTIRTGGTQTVTTSLPASTIRAGGTQTITTSLLGSTITIQAPPSTVNIGGFTQIITTSLPASTVTTTLRTGGIETITTSLAALTITLGPEGTQTITIPQPASTITIFGSQETITSRIGGVTQTIAASTVTIYEPASTVQIGGSIQTITTYLPASTITVTEQSTARPSTQAVDFGAGVPTYNTSSSGTNVSAAVTSGGPLQPDNGNSFL